jgi:molybdopterin converting factor subunit 1
MTLKILTFGIARDIIGKSVLELETTEGVTVEVLKQQLLEKYPRFGHLTSLMVAVNAEYGMSDDVLKENDEIALIPPVAGG